MSRLHSLAIFIVSFSAIGFLSAHIDREARASGFLILSTDPLVQMLGTAKEALGDVVYGQADTYFHGGLEEGLIAEHHGDEEEAHEEHEAEKEEAMRSGLTKDWIGDTYRNVHVSSHKHLEEAESKEILPILALATELNAHNVQAVLTAAYWFRDRLKDKDRALEIVRRGVEASPESWELNFTEGELLASQGKNREAVPHFLKAVKNVTLDEHTWFDPVRIRFALAQALEREGEKAEALKFYREALALYPASERQSALRQSLEERIQALAAF